MFTHTTFVGTRSMRTAQAQRVRKAERIIRQAYRMTRETSTRRVVRFELLGSDVAVAVVRDEHAETCAGVRVAQLLPSGRAKQMRKESRKQFATIGDLLSHFDALYAKYGKPNG